MTNSSILWWLESSRHSLPRNLIDRTRRCHKTMSKRAVLLFVCVVNLLLVMSVAQLQQPPTDAVIPSLTESQGLPESIAPGNGAEAEGVTLNDVDGGVELLSAAVHRDEDQLGDINHLCDHLKTPRLWDWVNSLKDSDELVKQLYLLKGWSMDVLSYIYVGMSV
eukprot:GHVQ01037497.1.p1 GENE.GHVQ01037497.1~~GHVQ01037497.1.p1  ORF type:complete len:164 (+),score=21.40 GHVQ01037497.1:150-641(+)